MGTALDLPAIVSSWEPVGQVDAAAIVAALNARTDRLNAEAAQAMVELAEMRAQREPAEQPGGSPQEARELAKKWAAGHRGPPTVIDLSETPADEGPPMVIELATGSPELAGARELAERWAEEQGR
ncbi:MAG: hypothetical protein AABM42_01870 [Actinomycetota bacterium]